MYIDLHGPDGGATLWGAATAAAPVGSVPDARRIVATAFDHFAAATGDFWMDAHGLDGDDRPAAPVHGLRVTTGVGKSHAARSATVAMVRRIRVWGDTDRAVVLAVPRHNLADEFADDLRSAAGELTVAVYRGRGADDPNLPGETMCRRDPEAAALQRAGGSVESTLCRSDEIRCPFYGVCGYQRQKRADADIWVIPQALLWQGAPKMINPVALIVDEDASAGAFGGFDGTPVRLSIEDLRFPLAAGHDDEVSADLAALSGKIASIVASAPEGGFQIAELTRAGITEKDLRDGRAQSYRAVQLPDIGPLTSAGVIHERLAAVTGSNRIALRRARLFGLLAAAMCDGADTLPGSFIETVRAREGEAFKALRIRWRKSIAASWNVPTLLTSATAHPDVLRAIWPALGEVTAADAAMPYATIRQITDRSFSASSVCPGPTASEASVRYAGNVRARLRRYIEVRTAELPGRWLVIGQERLVDALKKEGLPANVETIHFNGLSGLDRWRDVRGIIIIGRTMPSPADVEDRAEVLSGQPIERLEGWYPRLPGFLNLNGKGEGPAVMRRRGKGEAPLLGTEGHPDRLAEALRWGICEGELIQAIGRGRGVNRTAQSPLAIDILTAIPLPVAVNEAGPFDQFEPTPMDLMAARGVVVTDTSAKGAWHVVGAMLSDLFSNAQAAKDHQRNNPSQWNIPISIYIGKLHCESAQASLKLESARYAVPVVIGAGSEGAAKLLIDRLLPGSALLGFNRRGDADRPRCNIGIT